MGLRTLWPQWLVIGLVVMLGACALPPKQNPGKARVAEVAAPSAGIAATARGCERLLAQGLEATFVLYRPDEKRYAVCAPQRAQQRFLPASTFKIANALIGLETGAVRDEHEVAKWDGIRRGVPAWNQDTDLGSGMRNSTVWFYQALARRIGPTRMRDWIGRLDYGNADIGTDSEVDHFWLNGALRISAFEQVAFLDRLSRYQLPLSERSQAAVIRILEKSRGAGWVLRGKAGAALPGEHADENLHGAEPVGWFVGWVERDGHQPALFAFNMKLRSEADMPLREPLARELLIANGLLPAAGER